MDRVKSLYLKDKDEASKAYCNLMMALGPYSSNVIMTRTYEVPRGEADLTCDICFENIKEGEKCEMCPCCKGETKSVLCTSCMTNLMRSRINTNFESILKSEISGEVASMPCLRCYKGIPIKPLFPGISR